MLSAFSTVIPAESLLGNPLTGFNGGFTPWENLESFFSSFDQSPSPGSEEVDNNNLNSGSNLSRYHAGSDSGSVDQDQNLAGFGQVSPDLDPNQNSPEANSIFYFGSQIDDPSRNSVRLNSRSYSNESNLNSSDSKSGSGLDEPNQVASTMDERKRRRMISNRESARRSRMRKQRHVENLRNDVNRVKLENRELTNQLHFVTHHIHLVRRDNDQLTIESVILHKRLMEFSRILQLQQLQQNQLSSQLYHQ